MLSQNIIVAVSMRADIHTQKKLVLNFLSLTRPVTFSPELLTSVSYVHHMCISIQIAIPRMKTVTSRLVQRQSGLAVYERLTCKTVAQRRDM